MFIFRNEHQNNSSSQSSGNKKIQQNANPLNKRNKKNTGGPSNTPINLNTYGLSTAFLNQLGITVPILNKIFVANVRIQSLIIIFFYTWYTQIEKDKLEP